MSDSSPEVPVDRARLRNALGGLLAALLGIAAFFAFAGWQVLLPTNIGWLRTGDRAMHTLGWFFFRDAPWGMPPGASPNLGIELSNSIALVDGLPLFAFPFKLFSQWLPRPFQYWGLWWLLCFVLQSIFAYRLARELEARRLIALLAAGFCLITAAFLVRLPLHMALAGHWVVIAALYLYAKRRPANSYAWPVLIGVTAAIHAYLLAMVLGIWVASLVQRWLLASSTRTRLLLEIPTVALLVVVIYWGTGFFYTGSLGAGGFGRFRLNVLGPFLTYKRWSHVFPNLPSSGGDYEGTSFLGIGIIGVLLLCIVSGAWLRLRSLFTARWFPLWLIILMMVVFALSNNVAVLNHETGPLPIPKQLEALGEMFRSSGRFVWPALYLTTVGSVVLLSLRLRPAWAAAIVTVLLVWQVIDSRPGWSRFLETAPIVTSEWQSRLVSPFWDRVAEHGFMRVRAIPAAVRNPNWRMLGYYAYMHGMATDAVHLGRVDRRAVEVLKAADDRRIATGDFDPRTLYLLDVHSALAIARKLQPDDLLALIDGRIVFARHGAGLVSGLGIDPHSAVKGKTWLPPLIVAKLRSG